MGSMERKANGSEIFTSIVLRRRLLPRSSVKRGFTNDKEVVLYNGTPPTFQEQKLECGNRPYKVRNTYVYFGSL